jgi:urate oxidase
MDLFSFLSFHFMCVTVTVVTVHSVALSRRSHLFSTMSSLHDVLVHDICNQAYHEYIKYTEYTLTPKRRTYDRGMRLFIDTQFCYLICR